MRSILALTLAWLAWPTAGSGEPVRDSGSADRMIQRGGDFTLRGSMIVTNTLHVICKTNSTSIIGESNAVIDGANLIRLLHISKGATCILENLTLQAGKAPSGGAIFNDGGTLILSNTIFLSNTATNAAARPGSDGADFGEDGGAGENGASAFGGAIFSRGPLKIYNSIFTNNVAAGNNGGDGGDGADDPVFGGNGGDGGAGGSGFGGALWCNANTVVLNTIFADNTCSGGHGGTGGGAGNGSWPGDSGSGGAAGVGLGAAIFNAGQLSITNCTFAGGSSYGGAAAGAQALHDGTSGDAHSGGTGAGGAIYNQGRVYVLNSTFAANLCQGGPGGSISASDTEVEAGNGGDGQGGALASSGNAILVNCTLAQNNAFGGTNGVSPIAENNGNFGKALGGNLCRLNGSLIVSNSILAHSRSGANCYGGMGDGGYNISSDASCGFTRRTSRANLNPQLADELSQSEEALTAVLELADDSPAIDAIPLNGTAYVPTTDQIGTPRPQSGGADIGAFEVVVEDQPPYITRDLLSTNLPYGSNVVLTLSVGVRGSTPLTYEWFYSAGSSGEEEPTAIGEDSPTLTITSPQVSNSGFYFVKISNEIGEAYSSEVRVTVQGPPWITAQPESPGNVLAGETVSMTVVAAGTRPMRYQWYRASSPEGVFRPVIGGTQPTLILPRVRASNSGFYKVIVQNLYGKATNDGLVEVSVSTPPTVTGLPERTGILLGATKSLSVIATGDPALKYQWSWNDLKIEGATNSAYLIDSAQLDDSGTYSVVVQNDYGQASASTLVTVGEAVALSNLSQSRIVLAGTDVQFGVAASGTEPLAYSWFRGTNLLGNAPVLQLTNAQLTDAGTYRLIVSNAVSAVTNEIAGLAVVTPLVSRSVVAGTSITNKVVAAGTGLNYRWTWNGQPLANATNATYILRTAQLTNSGAYAVTVSNAFGAVTTTSEISVEIPVAITNQPRSVTVSIGESASFSVGAKGSHLQYQWFRDPDLLAGETNASLIIPQVSPDQAGYYFVTVSNGLGGVTSTKAALVVQIPAIVLLHPESQTGVFGSSVTFSARGFGTPPLSYQWSHNGSNIVGATASNLSLTNLSLLHQGSYAVVISNRFGSAQSTNAVLNVIPPSPIILLPTNRITLESAINISGTVPNNAGITGVVFRVNPTDATPAQAAAGTSNWTATVDLNLGTNLFEVWSVAAYGESRPTLTELVRLPADRLTVLTNGNGRVSPDLNGVLLAINSTYTMTAVADPGWIFADWRGGVEATNLAILPASTSSNLNFAMRSNYILQANFIPSPFLAVANSYHGLFYEPRLIRHDSSGAVAFRIDQFGVVAGELQQGTNIYAFNGQFDTNGNADLPGGPGGNAWRVLLSLDLANPTNAVQGSIIASDGTVSSLLAEADCAGTNHTGRYTFFVPPSTENFPMGVGVAAAEIDVAGRVSIAGSLADNTAFQQTNAVSVNGWPLYAPLYEGRGSILSWMTFTNDSTEPIAGDMLWIRPALDSKLYSRGFTNYVSMVGSPYPLPASGTRVLDITNASVVLSGGNLASALTNTITLQTNNTVLVTATTCQLKLKINATNGLVSGSFVHPVARTINPIQAVVLRQQNTLKGFFVGTNQTGTVELIK